MGWTWAINMSTILSVTVRSAAVSKARPVVKCWGEYIVCTDVIPCDMRGGVTPVVYVLWSATVARTVVKVSREWFSASTVDLCQNFILAFDLIPFIFALFSCTTLIAKLWPSNNNVWPLSFALKLPCSLTCYLTAVIDRSTRVLEWFSLWFG